MPDESGAPAANLRLRFRVNLQRPIGVSADNRAKYSHVRAVNKPSSRRIPRLRTPVWSSSPKWRGGGRQRPCTSFVGELRNEEPPMAKSHEADGSKRPGTPGPSLPDKLEDFKDECTLAPGEKEFVIRVCKVLRRHPTRNNVRQFVRWTEEQADRPEWARCTTRKLKDSLYESLNCSAKHIPPWPMVAWIIKGTMSLDPGRDDVEQELATEYKRLTGVHPPGYTTRSLIGEPPLTAGDAPDTATEMSLLRKEVSTRNAELAEARHRLARLSTTAAELDAARDEISRLRTTITEQRDSLRRDREGWRRRTTSVALAGTRSANHVAVTAAWLDAHGIMHDDFDYCVRLLNVRRHPEARVPRILSAPRQHGYRAVTRWITVHLRAFVLSRYGDDIEAAFIDDSTGQLSALVQHGTLPSAAAVKPLLAPHQLLNRFVPRLLEEAEAECRRRADERSGLGETTVLDAIPAQSTNDEHGRQLVTPSPARAAALVLSPAMPPPDELSARRDEKRMNGETVFLQISALTQQDMTDPNAAERVIAHLRALEGHTA